MSSLTRRDGSPGRQLMMAILKSHWARASRSQAQAMLEFALALPVLLTLIYGLLETGRLLFIYASTVTAARQAVRYGSATGDNSGGIPFYQDCDGIRGAVHNVGFINRFEDSDILITYDRGLSDVDTNGDSLVDYNDVVPITSPDPDCDGGFGGFEIRNGDRIRVQVSADWIPIVPIVPLEPFTITSHSSRTILQNVSIYVTAPASGWAGSSGGLLALDVDAFPTTYDTLGEIITYTYTLTNTGASDLTADFGVVDIPVASNNCASIAGPLAPSASVTCTGTYAITQEDLDAGFVTDVAQASANNGTVFSALDGTTITAIQLPALTLEKTGEPDVSSIAGTIVTYTFQVVNSGNVTLRPPYAVSDDQTNDETCLTNPTRFSPGETITCTAHHTITTADINATRIINHATASARFGSTTVTSNEDSFIVYTPPVYLTIDADRDTVTQAGQVITYTYYLYNSTDSNLTSPYGVSDSMVTGVSCAGATSPLAPAATTTCTGTYTVTQTNMDNTPTPLVNTATATALQGTKVRTSQLASASVAVTGTPAISLQVTAEPDEDVELGDGVTYTYLLTNTGTVTLSPPFTVTDDKVTGITCPDPTTVLAANGGTKTCTATRTITVEDMQNGSVISTATASGMFKTQVVASSPVTTTVVAYVGPRLGLTKATEAEVVYFAGTPISYTYTLRNTGSVPLSAPFSVSDNKVLTVDCLLMPPTLNLGQSASCSGTHITQLPDDGPVLTNIATAMGYYEGSPVTSEPATESVYVSDKACDVKHNAMSITTTNLSMGIFNHNTFPVTLSSVEVFFNDAPSATQQWITSLVLGGSSIWSNAVDHGTPKLASPLVGNTTIAAGGSQNIVVNFRRLPYTPFTGSSKEYIHVNFSTAGCGMLKSEDPGQQEPVAPTP